MTGKWMVTVACADVVEGRRIARALVEKRLAACVQLIPGIESVYRWKGAVTASAECLLLIKTSPADWGGLVDEVKALHSYEVPEILAFGIEAGLPAYLAWMETGMDTDEEERS